MAQPALGAVLAAGGLPSARVMVVGPIAAAAGFLAAFSLNDVLDRRADAEALAAGDDPAGLDLDLDEHPLARGDVSLGLALAWVVSLGAVAALLAWWLSPTCLVLFAAAVGLECLYSALRSVTVWKLLAIGVTTGLAGLAGWATAGRLTEDALAVFLFLALWEIGGRNIVVGLVDPDGDARAGTLTVAGLYGPRTAARAACILGYVTLAATTLLPFGSQMLTDLAIGLGLVVLAWPGAFLWHDPSPAQARSYVDRASFYPLLVLAVALLPSLPRVL